MLFRSTSSLPHAVLKVIKAGRRLVLISATGNEGQILKIRPPLVFSSKAAKLFPTTLDEVLAAPYRACTVVKSTPHLLEFLADADPDLVLINGTGGNHGKRHGHAPAGFGAI